MYGAMALAYLQFFDLLLHLDPDIAYSVCWDCMAGSSVERHFGGELRDIYPYPLTAREHIYFCFAIMYLPDKCYALKDPRIQEYYMIAHVEAKEWLGEY